MPGAARLNDTCTGHQCWPSRENDGGSGNVFVNKRGAHRKGDHWVTHCCNGNCHDSTLESGSDNVYVNGKPFGRKDDPVACGSKVKTASSNVYVNGS